MKTGNIASVSYFPSIPPTNSDDINRFLVAELNKISNAINLLAKGHIDMDYAVPTKPRNGDIRLADGTKWNPGSGIGFYGYYNSAWHFLG